MTVIRGYGILFLFHCGGNNSFRNWNPSLNNSMAAGIFFNKRHTASLDTFRLPELIIKTNRQIDKDKRYGSLGIWKSGFDALQVWLKQDGLRKTMKEIEAKEPENENSDTNNGGQTRKTRFVGKGIRYCSELFFISQLWFEEVTNSSVLKNLRQLLRQIKKRRKSIEIMNNTEKKAYKWDQKNEDWGWNDMHKKRKGDSYHGI